MILKLAGKSRCFCYYLVVDCFTHVTCTKPWSREALYSEQKWPFVPDPILFLVEANCGT